MAEEFDWRKPLFTSSRHLCTCIQCKDDLPCENSVFNGSRFLASLVRDHGDDLMRELSRRQRQRLVAAICDAGEVRQ